MSAPADERGSALERELQALRAMPPVRAALPHTRAPSISAAAKQHPDLYAAEFTRMLLTQDFRRGRDEHIARIASESATTREPLVVGLVPEDLRDKLAVFSVTDSSTRATPIPSAAEWGRLGTLGGHTTVSDVRVSQPEAWTTAVDAGRITDPGITARTVTATVTSHTIIDGQPQTSAASIEITANFEGPPSRPQWGFVTAVTYTRIATGQT
ncbi:hypothetical protein ACFQU3_19920 [Terrabacter sp. GCM10028922]|uniref:hypothetical protein n=1 Tax=Terrabacter sp. GCM10028922 TaxID=3273428 RepID=UPI0036171B82